MTWCLGFCHCCLTWSTYGLVVKRSKSNSPISLEALKAERESSSPTMFGERRSRLWSSLKSPQRRAPQPKVQRSTSQRGKFNFSRASAFKGHSFCWFVMAFVLRSRLTEKNQLINKPWLKALTLKPNLQIGARRRRQLLLLAFSWPGQWQPRERPVETKAALAPLRAN